MIDVELLKKRWLAAKELEVSATATRREIEDVLIEYLKIDQTQEGTTDYDGIKVTTRFTRKVDGDALQDIAMENGISDHLLHLFRWKPEINMAIWKATEPSITKPLEAAITTKSGRPSFKMEN